MRRLSARLASVLALPLLVAACPGASTNEDEGELVVGVQAEELGGLVGPVHMVAKVDGVVVEDVTARAGAELPKELSLRGPAGARADVVVEAQSVVGGPLLATRAASARVPAAGKRLLRIQLQHVCASVPPAPGDPAPRAGISCDAGLTCVSGRCVAPDVPDAALEDYAPDWAKNPPDMCKPARAGAPELVIGSGMTDYASLGEGETLYLERGPQGGHHVWIALRMKNLRQSGSMTTIRATVPDDPSLTVPDAAYIFTFDRDEGAYCKLYGLRFQVDSGARDLRTAYQAFLGKRLAVTVDVVDPSGAKGTATKTIQLAPRLLCPDGTTSCNPTP